MAGGMHSKPPGVPLGQRPGPGTATRNAGLEPPPGTRCWVRAGDELVPGVVLGWQQHPVDGQWHALVSAWWPAGALQRRD